MGEEVKMIDYQDGVDDDDDARVSAWEMGLPTAFDLTPLSQSLIPPELATAFSISPEPHRTLHEVTRASRASLSTLRGTHTSSSNNHAPPEDPDVDDTDPRKLRRIDIDDTAAAEEADSASRAENPKRARLVWSPQLHKRFVEVVAHLGIKNAVPKTIMQLMNVEGLTRENVASHLQKYRLYLKRQGFSDEGPFPPSSAASSDQVGHNSFNESGSVPVPMMPVPLLGMPHVMGSSSGSMGYHGFHSHHYNVMHHRDWSGNMSYPHLAPNHKSS